MIDSNESFIFLQAEICMFFIKWSYNEDFMVSQNSA